MLLGGLVATIVGGLIVSVLANSDNKPMLIENIFDWIWQATTFRSTLALTAIIAVILVADTLVSLAKMSHENHTNTIEASRIEIKDLRSTASQQAQIISNEREKARLDITTLVPNEFALKEKASEVYIPGKVLILIDIAGFGEFNKKYSHLTGDAVLREFAQFLQNACRRTENVYRMIQDESEEARLVVEAGWTFRLHRKGDEFLVVLDGGEAEALGFLNRLKIETTNENSRIYSSGGEGLLFYAGVYAVEVPLTQSEYQKNLEDALKMAREGARNRRVVWHSNISSETLARGDLESPGSYAFRKRIFEQFEKDEYWASAPPAART